MIKVLGRTCILLAAAAVASVVFSCSRSDPERELRSAVAAMAQAIEQREPAAFLDSISDDFARESGTFGKQEVKRLLAGAYLRNEKISVNAVVSDVRADGDRARAKIRVLATGGAGLLPERGQSWDFDSVWRRESGRWKVYNAEWTEAL
ncbi:MAG: nuclear transport factor 2 family protein [Burkholderiaceae bacterium]